MCGRSCQNLVLPAAGSTARAQHDTMAASAIALGPATMVTALAVLPLTSLSLELLAVPARHQLLIGSLLTALYGLASSAALAVLIP